MKPFSPRRTRRRVGNCHLLWQRPLRRRGSLPKFVSVPLECDSEHCPQHLIAFLLQSARFCSDLGVLPIMNVCSWRRVTRSAPELSFRTLHQKSLQSLNRGMPWTTLSRPPSHRSSQGLSIWSPEYFSIQNSLLCLHFRHVSPWSDVPSVFGNHLLVRPCAVTLAALLCCLYQGEDSGSSLGTFTGPPGVRDEVKTPHKAFE